MAAAQVAGLNCLRLMNETTAGKPDFNSFYIVYVVYKFDFANQPKKKKAQQSRK